MPNPRSDYMPRPDADFLAWARQFYDAVEKWWSVNSFPDSELLPLKNALQAWSDAFPAHVAAQAAAESARAAKDAARAALVGEIRPITNFIQSYPKTTDADRATIGITVRGGALVRGSTPTTAPIALVAAPARLTHQLRLIDESTPTRRARPRGTLGAEVWVALVAPGDPAPTDPSALSFLALATKQTFRAEFTPADGGKTAVYMARWVSTLGEKGPWSEVATMTIAA